MKLCAQKLANHLDSENYNYSTRENDNGNSVVIFPYKGKEAQCVFSGDDGKYLSIYMVYESVPEDRFAQALIACNEVNVQYKWVAAYLDEERDIMLHLDALLSPRADASEAFEMLARFLDISEKIKPVIMKAIYG